MSYHYELHCHTSEVSPCGKIPAAEVVRLLKEKGYSGVVITDHLTPKGFDGKPINNWEKFVDRFLLGYRSAKEAADEDFDVILGAEIRFPENNNDYLLYGLTEEFLYSNPYINRLSLQEFRSLAFNNKILIIQAHPFRNNMVFVDQLLLDGYEIHNGNMRHNSRNSLAFMVSQQSNMIITSGSDLHQLEDLAQGGIGADERIRTAADLAKLLPTHNYDILTAH